MMSCGTLSSFWNKESKTMKTLLMLALSSCLLVAQENYKLGSGEGLAFTDNAETHGMGNLWVFAYARGFYWDNPQGSSGGYPLKIFPSGGVELGLKDYLDVGFSSEVLSYGFKIPGNLRLKIKATLPDNKRLRLLNGALSIQYTRNLVKEYASFGYRNSVVGFYSEGLMMTGNVYEFRLLGDVELIQWKSFLPLKFYLNVGYRFTTGDQPYGSMAVAGGRRDSVRGPSPSNFDQVLLMTGLEYRGLTTDFFVEYTLEALNGFKSQQTIVFPFESKTVKVFPYSFSENPSYITPGLRIKYSNGVTLMAAVPILLSREIGFELGSLTTHEKEKYQNDALPLTDGFSPFYANWKVMGKISIPIHFRVTNAEITRKFLLMKNRGSRQAIDIDEAIQKKENGKVRSEEEKMQDDIEKRKQEILKENLLE